MRSRRRHRPLSAWVVPLALTAVLTACDSAEHDSGEAAAEQLGTVQSVDCPGKAQAVTMPRGGVPAPLPQGVVVVDVRGPKGGRTVVTGVVPRAERDVLTELQAAYPSAGLTLSEGETEARDAESNFEGNGVKGRWGIRELSDCSPVATRIDLVYAPVS